MKLKRIFYIIFFAFFWNIISSNLLDLAELYPTDKGVIGHNYLPIYNTYLSHLQNKPIKLLEIGFFHGDSARLWDHFFSQAKLYFIDINYSLFQKYGQNLSDRCSYHVVDQGSETALLDFIQTAGGDFDLIIDDGGHLMHQQIISFKTLFPFVKPGGYYVIEDLHTSYWSSYGGSGTMQHPKTNDKSTITFLQELLHNVNRIGARTGIADINKCPKEIQNELTYYQKHIKSVHFYSSICFIEKQ